MYKQKREKFKRRTVVDEIKAILQQYPDDGQIFKEIIQNAEDARASEIVFVFDKNVDQDADLHFSEENLRRYQIPSLYAYNNASFTPADWDGVISLGISGKTKQALKVGRFGLGFKSVFHLTDLPCVASDSTFAYLDPMKETFKEEVEVLDFDEPTDSDADFHDFKSFQRLGEKFWRNENGVEGTLFRLPLRLEASNLSSVIYDEERINALLERFKEEAHTTMIFLKHVKSIKIYTIENGSTVMKEVYSAKLTERSQEYQSLKVDFVEQINHLVDEEQDFATIKQLRHFLEIEVESLDEDEEEEEQIYEYAVCERYGYEGTNEDFISLMYDEELSYVPLVAIAYPINQDLDEGGHVFCTLPLPLHCRKMTGMPVHVNGFFALGQDRKDLKWKSLSTQGSSNDKTVNWNVYLLTELIPIVYSDLFDFLKTLEIEIDVLYRAWPDQNEIDSKWRPILNSFHDLMREKDFIYVGFQDTWYKTQNVWFIKTDEMTEDELSAVEELLVSTNIPFAIAPQAITDRLPCHWINSYEVNRLIIGYSIFIRLPMKTRCNILSYSVKNEDDLKLLINQKIFPIFNGNTFQLQRRNYHSTNYYITTGGNSSLLPSNERTVNESFFKGNEVFLERLKTILNRNEYFNMTVLDHSNKVVAAIKDLIPQRWKNQRDKLSLSEVSQTWLSDVIQYRKSKNISYSSLGGLPLIKIRNLNSKYLWKVGANPKPLVASYQDNTISKDLKSLLEKAGVFFVADDDAELRYLVAEGMVNVSNTSNIIAAMSSNQSLVIRNYPAGNKVLNTEIQQMINNYHYGIPDFFRDLPMFRTTSGRTVSCRNGYFVYANDIPREWNERYGNVISRNNIDDRLIQKLSGNTWTYEQVCKKLFTQNLNQNDLLSLSKAVLQRLQYSSSSALQTLAIQYVRIKNDNGVVCRPSDLFEKSRTAEYIFLGEKGRFPSTEYSNRILLKIGLKRAESVSYQEIQTSIQYIQSNNMERSNIITKVNAILAAIKNGGLQYHNFNNFRWIPAAPESPREYPQRMSWKGANNTSQFTSHAPTQIYLQTHQYAIGSVHYVVHPEVSANFQSCFGNTPHITKVLFQDVLANLKNLDYAFNIDEKATFQNMVMKIYQYLAVNFRAQLIQWIQIRKEFSIWHGSGFVPIGKIFLSKDKEQVTDVSPYFFQPQNDVLSILGNVLSYMDCQKSAFNIYVNTLKAIAAKYAKTNTKKKCNVVKDTNLALSLVKEIADRFSTEANENRADIFVPLDSESLKLAPLETCHYLDFSSDTRFSISSNILNRHLGTSVARQLNVPNLASKVLQGNQESIFKPWGQKQEPLTKNLKRILDDYQDGLAIIKELVQNADDAGASEVSILYDRRTNDNLKTHLISPAMKDWQGPALWVHNNKMFTEEDFINITRLNAGTKKSEATKIGKFGLGFNAVYHLTDVPSIMSGKSLIFFDPHLKYLGDAVRSREPGIRISLDKNADLKIYGDQFAVYEKIFGAQVDLNSNSPSQEYKGSLFRFPLRNANCARTSEINPLHYSDQEMRTLLNKVKDSLQTLILFTQNVSSFSVYELNDQAKSPTEMKLLFSTSKSKDHGIRDMVQYANKELERRDYQWYGFNQNQVTTPIKLTVKKDTKETTQQWIVQSRNGGADTYTFAKSHPNEGNLPYCSVAVCLGNKNDVIQQKGHLFCFLPLPIKNGLPSHVNAAFELSSNRLSLKAHNEDEKIYHTAQNWNDLIAKDAGNAYYSLLLHLVNKVGISGQDFYNLFPGKDHLEIQNFTKIILTTFLQNCFGQNDDVFPFSDDSSDEDNTWMQWKNLNFPGSSIPEQIQSISLNFLNWQSKKTQRKNRAIKLPPWFKNLIQKLGFDDQIKSKEVSFQQLLQLFSENVKDRGLPKEIREGIINYLLSKSILHRTSMIDKRCIPTKPNGRLRRTNELIQEGSDISILYDVTDERFPDLKDNDVIKYLQTHGMESGDLSWTKILDRAQTVEQSANKERGSALLRIISKKLERKDFPATQSDVEACNQLRGTKFLPVMKKPKKCLFNKWHGSTTKVSSPQEIYPHSFSNTLSCSNYICSEKMDDSVVKLFQIKVTPRQEDLATQLNEFLPKFETTNFKYRDALKEITILYSEIEVKEETRVFLSQAKFIMADNGQLYSADTMFLQVDHTITKKLHSIHGSYKDMKESERVQKLFLNVGVKPKATATHYATALKGLWEEYNNNRLTKFHIDEIYHLLPVLADFEEKHLFIDDLYLPDQQNILRKTSELCYNDVTWLPDDPDVHYSNSEISHQHAIQLKIKSRRSDHILRGKHIDDTPWIDDSQVTTESFGQYDNLTARIKRLIENYSDPFDILKETIQNADDAESNEIEFILDKRSHGTEKVISEKWEHLQGPGLLIVNDGKFTSEDLQGIQKLGVGSHKNDPLKTGKYGVGFNTVYSLTDCPILLTKVDGTEDRMCMFDPHRKYAEGATDKRPGCSFPDARTFLDPYDDVKSAFLFNEEDKETKTILRLPFRMGDTAKDSEISTKSVSIKTIEKTMKGFLEHADEFLLFLNNIKTIKIRIVNGEGEKDELFSVHSKLYDTLPSTVDSFKVSAKGFADRFGDIYSMIDSEMQLHRKHCIRHLKDDKVQHATHWDVFEQVGFSSFDDLPDSVKDTLESQTHHLVPKGGIAKLSSKDDCVECDREKCRKNTSYTKLKSLFCTLPINLETGISGIINGNFFLDSDNRRALYNGEDKNKEWNQSILNHCVLPCFISHLEFVKKHIEGKFNLQKVERKPDPKSQQNEQPDDIFLEKCLRRIAINNFLSLFPSTEESTDKYFKIFTKAFYMRITDKGNRLLPVHRPGDVKFWSPREFLLYEGEDSSCNLLNVMKMANLKVDVLPGPIIKDFSESGNKHDYSLTTATPTVVRELLNRENRLVFFKDGMEHSKSSLKTVENINTLLSFCLKKENDKRHSNPKISKMDSDTPPKADEKAPSIDLTGLPLCLLQDRTLKSFNSKPAFLTKYSTLFNEEKSRFMHKSSVYELSQEHIDQSCFKEFDLHQFKELLQNSTFNDLLKDSKIGDKDCEVNEFKAWIKNCWGLIESCFHEEKRKHKEEEKKGKREQKDESEEGTDKTKEVEVDYLENQLDIIKDVPLLLVKKGTKESLLPIENRKKILGPDHNNNKIFDFITKACGGFEVVTDYKQDTYCHQIYSRTMLTRMFGKADKFNDVVAALKYALSSPPGQELPVELTIDFLSRLSLMDGIENKIPREGKESLCSLPLFQHYDGKLVEASGNVCILPKLVPKSALSVIESKFTITVLENIPTLEKLYTGLGFETKGDEQFYIRYVIPSLTKFTDAQVQEYLYPYRDVVKVRTHVLDRLKGIPFVSTNESSCTRKDCSKLFHPDNELFKLMEPAGNFPNKGMYSMSNFGDFERDRWLDFFLSLGMCQCIESGDHFLKYARMLEDEDNEEKVKKVSQMLCKILLENLLSKDENVKKWSLDSNFLCKLKDIRFIAPHTGNKKFENMFPSKNSSTKRIAFNGSVTSNSFELVWTSKHVLPTYAINYGNKSMSLDVMSELGISNKDTVQMEFVKQNLTTILTSQDYLEATCSSSCFSVKAEHRDFYNKALTEVYEFCLKHPENIESLIDLSFILVNQSKMLEQPRRCIQQVIGTINPFLNEVHIAHGKYFSVFQSLGCSENAKFSHYVDVLSQIKQVEANQGKGFLDEKLVFRATRAVTYLSRVLFDDVSTKWKQDLYLPTFKFSDLKIRMVISNECLILDDASLEERLKLFDQPILRSSSLEGISVEKDVNDKLLKYLPGSTKPKTFRASVEEVLCETCIPAQIDKKHGARIWKQRMKNPAFINGFKRLLSHEEIKEEQNYEKILKSVQIAVMENLQTELRFEGVKIEGSKIAKNVFTHLTDEQLVIYFNKEYSSEQVVSASISNAISELFGDILKTRQTITCFTKLLEMKPDQIPGFLDSQKIVNLGDHSTFRRAGKPPPLGKPIPQEHHGILNFDVSFIIEVGDYVAYDENDEGEDYVYAKIVSMNEDGSVKIQLVNDEDVDEEDGEGSRDVPRSTLYKFENKYTKGTEAEGENTQEEPSQSQEIAQFGDDGENGNARKRQRTEKPKTREETRSFEEICDDIKKIIHDLKSKDEDEQKRVLRRLYLQWHPDKHPNKDLATEVFKFLMNEKKRLDSDFSEYFERWNEQASHNKSSRQSYERDFDDFFRQRSGHQESRNSGSSRSRNSESSRSRNDYTGNEFHYDNVPPRFTRENPQPAEARRWFKQAQHDLNQASEIKTCPEWICYVSHQVAEKALKAAIFSKDYQGALYNEHNLCNLIREFQHADRELRNDLQELQTLVVDEDEPRYPRWSMKIPHEKFNQQKADKALVLAQRIVDNIRTNFEVE